MEFKKGELDGKVGYHVLKDGKYLGLVYKEVGIGSVEMWRHNKDGMQFGTRKQAGTDLVIRFGKKETSKVKASYVVSHLNMLIHEEGSNVRFRAEERGGERQVIVIGLPRDKYIETADLKLSDEFYTVLNRELKLLGVENVEYDNYRQSFWSKVIEK
ncbi:hypothetical protein [Bacillus thuringiensis]|uniref:hypothetical protein n=1 Tax=Bacillus thuringiensis TaxID=1428 RepID=UPI000BFCBC45|nr:hypothetical protein [Bacillus thuringiensis]PGT90126.1 hypothetical protein COD17_10275 [Bacillus thuringiensis]